jgi:hypothetical protein
MHLFLKKSEILLCAGENIESVLYNRLCKSDEEDAGDSAAGCVTLQEAAG